MPRLIAVIACLLLCLTACSAPATQATPSPPPGATGPVVNVDTSCRVDADCTVKDVGNCCGYYPACVNVSSPTDPAGVQASCQARGMMSVCGFRQISGCRCVAGTCSADSAGNPLRQPITELPEPTS